VRDSQGTADNVYLEDGHLVLRSQRQKMNGYDFTSGAVRCDAVHAHLPLFDHIPHIIITIITIIITITIITIITIIIIITIILIIAMPLRHKAKQGDYQFWRHIPRIIIIIVLIIVTLGAASSSCAHRVLV
jgi:hypothetical protein